MKTEAAKQDLAPHALFRRIAIWGTSVFTSLILSATFVYVVVGIAISNYEEKYPFVLGEDDLGVGLTFVFWLFGSVIVAIPMCIAQVFLIKKIISKCFERGE